MWTCGVLPPYPVAFPMSTDFSIWLIASTSTDAVQNSAQYNFLWSWGLTSLPLSDSFYSTFKADTKSHTVECRYDAVQHNMIVHMVQQWPRQNIHCRLYSRKHLISYPHGRAMGVFRKDLGENWPLYNGTALYLQSNRQKLYIPHCCKLLNYRSFWEYICSYLYKYYWS